MPKPITDQTVVCVHNGVMHADEIFSIALLKLINPNITVVRTRDEKVLQKADLRVDVGGKYDPETGDFDHHQDGFDVRHDSPNSVKYPRGPKRSGLGLVWLTYGKEAIKMYLQQRVRPEELDNEGIDFVFETMDKLFVAPIDAIDNGEAREFYLDTGIYKVPSVHKYFQNLMPMWMEHTAELEQEAFQEAVTFASGYLRREILKTMAIHLGKYRVLNALEEDKSEFLVLDEYIPWSPIFTRHPDKALHIKMVIFPSNDVWMVQSPYYNSKYDKNIPNTNYDGSPRKQRYPAPSKICGKNNEELAKLTGVSDAVFIHATGFIGAAKSKEGALALATYIIENQDV